MNKIEIEATQVLARFVTTFSKYKLSQKDYEKVGHILLDYYCAAITGAQTETSKLVYKYLLEVEGEGNINVIGGKRGLSVANAAFVNGTSAHCLDFDDGHTHGSIHPAAPIIPAIMAIAEEIDATSEDVIRAIIVGYEVCLRIASAIHPNSRKRGFHNTSIAGIFGATAAVSFLYKMDEAGIESALGVAASFAGGLFAFLGTGSEVKRIHPGQAARDGIHAAKLSLAGLTGPQHVLEGENGFFQAFAGYYNSERLVQGLGKQLEIYNVYFKPYPCCRHLHVIIDIIYEIKKNNKIELDQIEAIHIGVNHIAGMHNYTVCNTLLDTQMSMPYAVALALAYDGLNIELFNPLNTTPLIQGLLPKINIYIDEEIDNMYPAYRAGKVQIVTSNQEVYEHFSENPLGEPRKPLSEEQMKHKFLSNCTPILGEKRAHEVLMGILQQPIRLEELSKL